MHPLGSLPTCSCGTGQLTLDFLKKVPPAFSSAASSSAAPSTLSG